MSNHFACLLTAGAESGVGLRDAVEVVVQGCVLRAELDEQASLSAGEGVDQSEEGCRREGGVYAISSCCTGGESPFGLGGGLDRIVEGLSDLGEASGEYVVCEPAGERRDERSVNSVAVKAIRWSLT